MGKRSGDTLGENMIVGVFGAIAIQSSEIGNNVKRGVCLYAAHAHWLALIAEPPPPNTTQFVGSKKNISKKNL